ncbi:Methyl farnesoate epoxidase [Orchesella cincta]|uniref:Methyl farnesoate epoxidase n=1 Tax=Orchesella cincta TaxID=48709 RepID=A0A1D2MDN2_ORCCI|nr:Methyl farnesoate epoxidase [Orchesella cincta]
MRTLSGESTNWDSEDKPEIVKKAERLFESANSASIIVFAPFLRHIAPKYFGWTAWTTFGRQLFRVNGKAVKKHSKELDADNPKDFIDVYLLKIRETTDPTSSFYQNNGVNHLKAVLFDVFAGGSETTSATLSFATLYLLLNKEAQRNAQKELDRVVGSSRQVSLSDRPELPYNKAIVLETLRLSSVAPLGMPHRMIADTMFHGYLLPKDVTIFANFHAIHHDPNIWGKDVNEFRPERFLSEDKTEVIHHEALTPFSVGRRVCIGEGLAKDMLFTFIASILQNFNIEPDPECPVLKAETVSENQKGSRYPPGPKSIPLLGNVLQLGKDPLGVLQKWAEKYGLIFSVKMGTQDTIIISDPKLVKELYSDINSTGRAANAVTNYFGNGYGIVQAQDQIWESQRRFTLRKLRDVGVLKSSIEGFIMEETATLIKFFQQNVGKPISGMKLYNGPVVTALWRTISGESIDWVALPYTEAIILETLRLSSIIPLGIPHQMLADTEFQGFFLPKGATVLPTRTEFIYDPKIWGDDVNN